MDFSSPSRLLSLAILLTIVLITFGYGKVKQGPATLPLTLDKAIQIALSQNPHVLQVEQEIQRTRGNLVEVRSQALPHVNLYANFQQQAQDLAQGGLSGNTFGDLPTDLPGSTHTPSPTVTPTPSASPTVTPLPSASPRPTAPVINNISWQITLEVSQVIYAGGRIKASIKMARFTEDQSIFKLRDTIDSIVATVRQQFYQVLLNKSLIVVQQEAVDLLRDQLRDQTARFEAGTVPRFNVLQAEVALANAIPNLIQAKNNYRLSQLQLAKTLGYEVQPAYSNMEPFEVIGTLDAPLYEIDFAKMLQHAREQRPSLKAQRMNILIEIQDVYIQESGYKPIIQANGGYIIQNDRLSKAIDRTVHGWFYGVQGSWAIFDGLETNGRVQQAKARLNQARIQYDDAVAQVDYEVQQAHANLIQAVQTVASQIKNLQQAREAVRMAQERLASGAGTQLDLLNATVSLTQTETTTLQAKYNYLAALADLERAAGVATRYSDSFKDPLTKKRRQRR